MQPGAARRAEFVVQRGAHQSVGECIALDFAADLGDQRGGLGFVDGVEDRVLRHLRDLLQQAEVKLAPDHRRKAQGLVRALGEPRQTSPDRLLHALGNPEVVAAGAQHPAVALAQHRAGFGKVAQGLGDEQRAALGLLPDGARHGELRWIEVVAGRRGHEGDDAGLVEAAQREPLDPGLPAEVGEHRGERVGTRQLGVAIGDDDEEMHRHRRAHDVLEQQQLRRACPLQIIEDEHDRAVLRGDGEEAGNGLEHQKALGLWLGHARRRDVRHALAELGHHAQQLALMLAHMADEDLVGRVRQVVAQRLDEGPVGQADVLVAGPEQHHGALTMGD